MEPKKLQTIRYGRNLAADGHLGETVATMRVIAHDALAMIHYRDDRPVLLFASGDVAAEPARRAIEESGLRLADCHPIAGALERLDRQAWTDTVYVEGAGAAPEQLEPLLDRVQEAALHGQYGSVVSVPLDLLEFAFARAPDVELLCDPSPANRRAALAAAADRRPALLNDIGKGESAVLLHQMSEQMGKMASLLAELSEEEGAPAKGDPEGSGQPQLEAGQVRAIIRARRMRDQYLPPDLFADPAWDMLLDLMAARLEGHRVAVSSLCIAAAVPATTALRWIKMLTDQGLVVRSADPQDGRRVYIELADETARTLTAYLVAAQRISSFGI